MSDAQSTRAGHDPLSMLTLTAGVLVCALPVLFIVGKAAVDIALSIVAAMFLARSALVGDWAWLRTPWMVAALCLWVYLVLTAFTADNVEAALGRALPWFRFLVFAAALQFWILSDPVWQRRLVIATGVVLAFVALDTFYQLAFTTDVFGIDRFSPNRLTGPIGDKPGKVGTYLMRLMFPALIPLVFWAASKRRNVLPKLAAIAAICLGVTAVQISGERMAFLLALFGLVLAGLLIPGAKRLLLAVLLVAGISVVALFAVNKTVFDRTYESTIREIEGFGESHYGRIWVSTLRIAANNPVFGIGLKNFRTECPEPAYGQTDDVGARCDLHPHNMYLEWLSETGAIGFAGFLVVIGLWVRHFAAGARHWRSEPMAVGPVIAVILFLWPIASAQSFFSNWNAALFWFLLGWALAATADTPRPRQPGEAGYADGNAGPSPSGPSRDH